MIDEELAEEYSKGLCKTCTVDTCRYNTLQTCAIKESIKQAFLAGLKAKTQWHNLRENPNDLPKNTESVLCVLWGTTYDVGYYKETDDELWHFDEYSISKSHKEDVVAWCEIPQFRDKE